MTDSQSAWILRYSALVLAISWLWLWLGSPVKTPAPDWSGVPPTQLDVSAARDLVLARLSQQPASTRLPAIQAPVWVCFWSADGQRLASAWGEGGPDWTANLQEAMDRGLALAGSRVPEVAAVEVSLSWDYRPLSVSDAGPSEDPQPGLLGLELWQGNLRARLAPLDSLRSQVTPRQLYREFVRSSNPSAPLVARSFRSRELVVLLRPSARAVELVRGHRRATRPDQAELTRFIQLLGQNLSSQARANEGAVEYLTRPIPGAPGETERALLVRQFLATWALARMAAVRRDPQARAAFQANLSHNLKLNYRFDGKQGYLESEDEASLGAAAVASLALAEGQAPAGPVGPALDRLILSLWQTDGSFRTFYRSERNDNQNFYPGEALLYWATAHSGDPAFQKRFLKSFRYYRDFHRRQRHPALIPWHTQACARMWDVTRARELRDFVFEMNDWLITTLAHDEPDESDLCGAFYSQAQPDYGSIPHTSAAGVYLEGLVDAYRLARAARDDSRASAYRRAILDGLSYLMSLQFRDEADLYWVDAQIRPLVRGGLRSSPWDSDVRVDNTAHCLLACLRLESLDLFKARVRPPAPTP